jgi:translation initiation factor 2B subunit (eIF-2B alpha/beta/delta family)
LLGGQHLVHLIAYKVEPPICVVFKSYAVDGRSRRLVRLPHRLRAVSDSEQSRSRTAFITSIQAARAMLRDHTPSSESLYSAGRAMKRADMCSF